MVRGSRLKNIISVILVIALFVAGVGVFTSFDAKKVDTIKSSAFSRGGLNSSGAYVKTKTSIYTEETFGCQGLRVEPDFEFIGTYDVYYYDYNGKFLEAKKGLKGIYDEDYPMAKLARIVINPELSAGEDKISWYSVLSVANMFDITVNKDQLWKYKTGNLYDDTKALYNHNFCMGEEGDDVANETGEIYLPLVEWDGCKVSEEILLAEDCNTYDIYYRFNKWVDMYTFSVIASEEGKILKHVIKHSLDVEIGTWMKITLELPDDTTAEHIRVRMHNDAECHIYGY